MLKKAFALAGGLVLSSLAQADGFALGVHGGLMGAGVDGYYRLNEKVVLRGSYNAFDYDYDTEEEDLDFEATYSFDNGALGVDWYPFAGGFRLSAAYVHNANELAMKAVPKGGNFELNDTEYSAAFVDNLKMQVSYPESGAYVGFGWGNPVASEKGFGVTFDVGAYYLGEPEVSQQLTCTAAGAAACPAMQDDAEADRKEIEKELSDFPFWPLIQLGLTYQF